MKYSKKEPIKEDIEITQTKIKNLKSIYLMSYNIRWNSMENPTLQNNIISNIINAITHYNLDIIGLQEAYKWKKILKHIDLKKYDYITNKSGKEEMVTLWNKHKFIKIKAYAAEFEDGRPLALILLKNISNNNIMCVINLHASHNINTQKHITDIINNKLKQIHINFDQITMIGDFNRNVTIDDESDYILYHNDINNNKKSKSEIIKKYVMKRQHNISKNTCCSIHGYGYKYDYDHIINSNKTINKIIITDTWYEKISSDHLMIIGEL